MAEPVVETENIAKEFSGVRVLNDINIEINRGEIFGLIGENGAGKSTLIKIINGIYQPTEGRFFFEGEEVEKMDPFRAKEIGISTIPQEFNLVDHLNVYENIFLGQEYQKNALLLDRKRMKQMTQELMEELEADISPEDRIGEISVAQKQMVEIAKAIAYESKLLIMDEPTTVLTSNEIEVLFSLMRDLSDQGVTIVYISHKLREVKKICNRVMVLRDGEFISLQSTDEVTEHDMANMMVGRELNQMFPETTPPEEEPVLEVKGLSSRDGRVENTSFQLKKGEILGFAGLVGAGRTELAETILGIREKKEGEILIKGEKLEVSSPRQAVDNGVAYLPEDRQSTGIIANFEVPKNITLISLQKYIRNFLISRKREKDKTQDYIDEFNIQVPSVDSKLETLSGGNQQKVSLVKSLDTEPEIFIFDEPTRGIDISAKMDIFNFINELVQSGISVIFISSELEEIIGMANRVAVMREGSISGILEGDEITEERIMYHATGLETRAV
ncbi:MAG: sugar ABC transporter ATP-binding protein [Candidatus Bipolaricaulota bacterium]|nr:sugar ABC transporter ATP-binding protein [Candidatus Bipolaricaulota bacterium]MBS3791510.1 sugar ABC transporter ATP-binding protein [Candidatus Bipolaricaulota bacterium]